MEWLRMNTVVMNEKWIWNEWHGYAIALIFGERSLGYDMNMGDGGVWCDGLISEDGRVCVGERMLGVQREER